MEKYVLTILSVVVLYAVIGMIYEQSTTTGLIIVNGPGNKPAQRGIIVHKPAESKGIIVHTPKGQAGISIGGGFKPKKRAAIPEGPIGKQGVSVGGGFRTTTSRENLQNIIKDTEAQQQQLRNKRQMDSTAFQNADQKTQQMYNQMSSVLKTMNEMRTMGSRGSP